MGYGLFSQNAYAIVCCYYQDRCFMIMMLYNLQPSVILRSVMHAFLKSIKDRPLRCLICEVAESQRSLLG